jgi:hypothetical protein
LDMLNRDISVGTPGIRSQLLGKTKATYAWGNSTLAGSPNYNATNFIRNDWHSEFTPFSRGTFNRSALNYAKGGLNHDNTSYR